MNASGSTSEIQARRRHSFRGYRRLALTLAMIGWTAVWGHAATIVVNNLANNGSGSLRGALSSCHDGDVITFAVTGTITNRTDLLVTNSVDVIGPGPEFLTVTGTNWYRAFRIASGVAVRISGMSFVDCYGGPPGMDGGAIYNQGNLTLTNCVFTQCRSQKGGVNLSNGGSGFAAGNGGAIFNSGMLVAVNCQFLANSALAGGSGSAGNMPNSYPQPITLGGNGGTGGHGGAVYDVGLARFTNCTFASNSSGDGGNGGAGGTGSRGPNPNLPSPGPGYPGGSGANGGNGSAVFSLTGATFVSCTFFGNTTGAGGNGGNGGDGYYYNYFPGGPGGNAGHAGSGALYSTGSCLVVACTFLNNTAGNGGSGGNGGNAGSTVNANASGASGGNGGNAGNGGSGGGIFGQTNYANTFALRNVLIAQNAVGYAGSAGWGGAGGSGQIIGPSGLQGTNAVDGTGPDLFGWFVSQKHNLIGLRDGSVGFIHNLNNDIVGMGAPIDPMIVPLNDNGGPVRTCALLPDSPAIDAGDDNLLTAPLNLTKDARGYARKAGARVDIGAYEYQQLAMPVTCWAEITGEGVRLSANNVPGATFTVLGTTDLTLPISSWDILGQMSETSPGEFQWLDPDSASHEFRFFSIRSP